MRKIPTIRFGSCDILLNLDLILDHLFDSRIFCSIFSCNHDIKKNEKNQSHSKGRVPSPIVHLPMVPLWTWRDASEQPGLLWLIVVKWSITWMFLGISCCFPSKKTYCTTGNYNNIVFFCDICCVCFLFFPSKNPEFPNGWNGCQQQQTASGQQFPRSIPGWHTVPSSVARAVVVASPCGSNETSILASGGWIHGGSRPQPKRDSHGDETVHPRKLTWNLNMPPWKRKNIFQTSIFGFHVNFRGCM